VSLDYCDLLVHFAFQHAPRGEDSIYLDRDLDLDLESGDLPLSLRGDGLLRLRKERKANVRLLMHCKVPITLSSEHHDLIGFIIALEILSHLSLRLHLFPLRQCLYLFFSLSQVLLSWFYSHLLPSSRVCQTKSDDERGGRQADRTEGMRSTHGKEDNLGEFNLSYSCSHPSCHLLPFSLFCFSSF
jgi:hypothetical protein